MMHRLTLTLLLVAFAPAWTQTLKLATVAPDGTVWMKEMRAAAERVKAATEGRVTIKYYPGGVMGNAATVRRKMRVGQLHGGAFTGGELAEVYPDFYLYGVPFLFRDLEQVARVRETLDPLLAEGLEKRGMVLLGLAGGGFGYLMSQRPIATREELIEARMWAPEGDLVSRLSLELAGVTPVQLPISDVYTGLKTGLIDTVVNTPTGAIAFQWHTSIRAMTDMPVSLVLGAMAIDRRAFERLAPGDRQVLRRTLGETFRKLEEVNAVDNVDARAALLDEGVELVPLRDDERAYWRELGRRTLDRMGSMGRVEFDHLATLRALLAGPAGDA